MSEKNKALAARIPLEAFNQGMLEVIDEVIADNSVDHSTLPPGIPPGKEGIKLFVKALRSAFPDFKRQAQDQLGMLQQLGFIRTPEAAPAR